MSKWAEIYPAKESDVIVIITNLITKNPYPDPEDSSTWLAPADTYVECPSEVDESGDWRYSRQLGFFLKPAPTPEDIKQEKLQKCNDYYQPQLENLKDKVLAVLSDNIPDNEKPIQEVYSQLLDEYTKAYKKIEEGTDEEYLTSVPKFCRWCGAKLIDSRCPNGHPQ